MSRRTIQIFVVGESSRGWPEGSLFSSYYAEVCVCVGGGATPFSGLLHFTLDTYLIMLSVKQGDIKYHFLSLWYDSTWDWNPMSRNASPDSRNILIIHGDIFSNHISVLYFCVNIIGIQWYIHLYLVRGAGVQIKPLKGRPRNGVHSILITLILFIEKEKEIRLNLQSTKKIPLWRFTRWNDNRMSSTWQSVHFLVSINYLLSNFLLQLLTTL